DELVEQYTAVITEHGGSVGRTENWGLKTLSYRINKNRKAHFALMDITSPAAGIQEMERQMRLNEDVLRTLTIKVDEHEDGPSVMKQKRDRDDRRRRERGEREDGDGGGFRGGDRGDRGDRDRGDRGERDGGERRPREMA
ncbi:MAG: 30S ribosomal protein S6, partial [Thalassococcus profundi]|uniref:30S ribosomal protein S6 n=1 Tax=Thalassococcus profundi TaxID=2282382 RepID=UPI0040581F74